MDYPQGTFGYDADFLKKHDSVLILRSGQAALIVSAKYQAKVFTSTADGDQGQSFGWVNYKAFAGPADAHMNAYGGENRIWLGPEGGRFSLFFTPGSKMVFDNWKTPAAFDTEPWQIRSQDSSAVSLEKDMDLINYQGTHLSIGLKRNIRILPIDSIRQLLGISPDDSLKAVGYSTENILSNRGTTAWTAETGMPCIWMLDMFRPSPETTIIIPYQGEGGKPATTDYFGEIDSNRIHYTGEVLYFKADGKSRGKLGMHPARAKNIAGSFDAAKKILTITRFDIDPDGQYLNQEWNTSKAPFSGDAINAYNDGPLANGSQMGPFYELESVAPAAFLAPGASMTHRHAVFHFTGPENALQSVAMKILGVSLEQIKKAL